MEESGLTGGIIGAAIEVHRTIGPGLLESAYEEAMAIELDDRGIGYERQKRLPVFYKNREIGEYRLDLLVEGRVVVELKSVERMEPVFEAQILSYMRMGGYNIGLIINFKSTLLKDGVHRFRI